MEDTYIAPFWTIANERWRPGYVEVEGLPDFEKMWFEFPKAWKLLVSSCQRKLVERRQRSEPAQPAPVPVLPTFSCDECEAGYDKLRALRSHQMRGHQRRWEARRYDLDSICAACRADFRSRPRVIQRLEVGAERCVLAWKYGALEPFSDDAVAGADQLDCAQGGTQSLGGAANVKRWSRWRMNTSLVEDECLWAMVFRLDGWLVCGRSFACTR